jgi:ParB-like nuclease domain
MSGGEEYTPETARAAAQRDQLREWVVEFLSSPGSDNAELAEQLTGRLGLWLGPVRVPIDDLHRLAGPPGAPVMRELDEDEWRDDVDDLSRRIEAGHEPPPVIASYRNAELVLEDGNHRVEAARRAGADEVWAVIGFESTEERDRYLARSKSETS